MNVSQINTISNKELNYIADSITNEDLLVKQMASTASLSQNSSIQQALLQHIQTHSSHLQKLVQSLEQLQSQAPTQPQ